jgi:hypothetical protein
MPKKDEYMIPRNGQDVERATGASNVPSKGQQSGPLGGERIDWSEVEEMENAGLATDPSPTQESPAQQNCIPEPPALPALVSKEPDLFGAIRRDIAALGLVGEGDSGLLVYVVYTSRLLEKPASIIARGGSGSGKSTLLRGVARLIPDDCKIDVMVSTPASWFNHDDLDFFKHKLLLGGERKHSKKAEARDATATLRQLISEREITRQVSVFDPETQDWDTQLERYEGPVAYAECTTSESVFTEDLNRLIQVYTDESEEQNRRVVQSTAARYDPDKPAQDTQVIIRWHHVYQRWLQKQPVPRVIIPYCNYLGERLPAAKTECRRLAEQLFAILETIVVMNRHKAQQPNGDLRATVADYQLARRLLLPSLDTVLRGQHHEEYQQLLARMPLAHKGKPFTATQVQEWMEHGDRMKTNRWLKKRMAEHLLICVQKGAGTVPSLYRLLEEARPEQATLPHPIDLREAGFV